MHDQDQGRKNSPDASPKEHVSFLATLGAVVWSFTGLRRKRDYERDVRGLNPLYVAIAALLAAAVFIAALILLARFAAS